MGVCCMLVYCASVGGTCRTRDAVDSTLHNAKLDPSELHQTAQCLYMSASLDNDALKLIEMDNSLLDSLLSGNW